MESKQLQNYMMNIFHQSLVVTHILTNWYFGITSILLAQNNFYFAHDTNQIEKLIAFLPLKINIHEINQSTSIDCYVYEDILQKGYVTKCTLWSVLS